MDTDEKDATQRHGFHGLSWIESVWIREIRVCFSESAFIGILLRLNHERISTHLGNA